VISGVGKIEGFITALETSREELALDPVIASAEVQYPRNIFRAVEDNLLDLVQLFVLGTAYTRRP